MPRIYSALYQPYTYDELLKPVQASTEAHKEVEKEYTDSMMIVDALRSRAEREPDAPWALNIINYANQLEGYATDLMQNGLTGTTPANLMSMHSGFGKTVTPVVNAIAREKELQAIRDKASGTRSVFGRNPTIQELIDNPTLTLSNYSGENIYLMAKDAAALYAAREIELFNPSNYNAYLYQYGKEQGFSNDEISLMLLNDPLFADLFGYIRELFGYPHDQTLTNELINKLNNEIVAGALAGFGHDIDMKYNNRPDYMTPLQWAQYHKLIGGDENPTGGTHRHGEYFKTDPKYQNLKDQLSVVTNTVFDTDGNMKNDFRNFKVFNENGKWMDMDFMKAYKDYIQPLEQYHADMQMYNPNENLVLDPEIPESAIKPVKPSIFKNMSDDLLEQVYQYYKGIGATKDTYNALKDLGVNNLSSDNHILTANALNTYTNNLASLQYTTKILYTDYDDVAQALREYDTGNRNRKYSKDVYEVDEYLNQGKSVRRNSKLGFEDLKKDDITGLEFSLKSKDYLYINISGKGKFKVPVSFFDVELGNEIDEIYNTYQKMDNPENPYIQQLVQDYIAEVIENFFREREQPVYGNTVKREL